MNGFYRWKQVQSPSTTGTQTKGPTINPARIKNLIELSVGRGRRELAPYPPAEMSIDGTSSADDLARCFKHTLNELKSINVVGEHDEAMEERNPNDQQKPRASVHHHQNQKPTKTRRLSFQFLPLLKCQS